MRTFLITLLYFGLFVLASSCGEDVQSEYAKDHASFTCQNVSTIAPLNNALNSFGQYCMISSDPKHYYFTSPTARAQVDKTQATYYHSYICYAGFIVGKTAITDLGSGNYLLVCYDRVCPNCYKSNGLTKPLVFTSTQGFVTCTTCRRTYDLNNKGIISEGDKGRKLLRYHLSYGNDVLIIQN